jgi:hypothetical protein
MRRAKTVAERAAQQIRREYRRIQQGLASRPNGCIREESQTACRKWAEEHPDVFAQAHSDAWRAYEAAEWKLLSNSRLDPDDPEGPEPPLPHVFDGVRLGPFFKYPSPEGYRQISVDFATFRQWDAHLRSEHSNLRAVKSAYDAERKLFRRLLALNGGDRDSLVSEAIRRAENEAA